MDDGRKVMTIAHMAYRPDELKRAITSRWVIRFTLKLHAG